MTSLTLLTNGSATGNEATWPGGAGVVMVAGTFKRGEVRLQFLAPDAQTWIDAGERTTFRAPGAGRFDLPAGVKIRAYVGELAVNGAIPTTVTVIAGTLNNDAAAAAGPDRELVVVTYLAKTASTGVVVGDTVTLTQVVDLSGATPSTVATIWRNQSSAQDLAAAPPAASLTISGQGALTNAELRASGLAVLGPLTDAQLRAAAVAVSVAGVSTAAGQAQIVAYIDALISRTPAAGALTDAQLRAGAVPVSVSGGPTATAQAAANASLASLDSKTPAAGPLTDAQLRAGAVPVTISGVATANAQATGNATLTSLDGKIPAKGPAVSTASTPVVPATDANIARETYSSVAILKASTLASGTGYQAFTSQACTALDVYNGSTVEVEYQRNGAGNAMGIPAGGSRYVQGITNANQIAIRRRDLNAVPVTVDAEAFAV